MGRDVVQVYFDPFPFALVVVHLVSCSTTYWHFDFHFNSSPEITESSNSIEEVSTFIYKEVPTFKFITPLPLQLHTKQEGSTRRSGLEHVPVILAWSLGNTVQRICDLIPYYGSQGRNCLLKRQAEEKHLTPALQKLARKKQL